ncbi:trypco2 family protein [Streptomyces sp. NPDC093591]|uniref:trypco2 family protein n=1 Tax=Streptomyces sp. NPDC093591 TaxID=3366044 RepID=UPI0037F5D9A3
MGAALDGIELTSAVRVLRDELVAAAAAADGERISFEVQEITLEFEVELRAEARAKAGFKAWVVSGEADGAVGRRRGHRVALTLKPKDAESAGGSVEIGNDTQTDLSAFGLGTGG